VLGKDAATGVFTAVAVVLALLALDDITTDTATSFTLERLTLAGCALWCVIVACRLVWQGRRSLGGISLGVVAACALAQRAIGPGTAPGMQVEYLVMVGGAIWFVILAAILVWFSRRADARAAR